MKCPACRATFSDLRDLCPHCLIDIRPHKQVLGIKVVHPELSYSELLQRLEKRAYLSKLTLQSTPLPIFTPIHTKESHEDAVLSLFEGAYHQLKSDGERSFEITVEQLQTKVNPEEVRLLYDLLTESLEEPERVERYIEDVRTSEKKKVESPVLQEELSRFEKQSETPIFSLKGAGLRSRADSEVRDTVLTFETERDFSELPFARRMIGYIVDIVVLAGMSLLLAVSLSAGSPDSIGALSLRELIVFHGSTVVLTTAFLGPLMVFYLLITKVFNFQSPGAYLVKG